jgi:hypothetical protein
LQVRQGIPVCNLISCRDRVSDRLRDLKLPNVPGCPQINAGATCLVLRGSNRLVMQSVTKGIVSGETNFAPLELFKNTGKTPKSSVPVLSAGPLYFLLSTLLAAVGFSHFWPFAWEFWSAHAWKNRGDNPSSRHLSLRLCVRPNASTVWRQVATPGERESSAAFL